MKQIYLTITHYFWILQTMTTNKTYIKKEVTLISNDQITIRKATKTNYDTIINIQKNDGFPHGYYLTHERLDKLFKRETFYLAIINGDKIGGFASVDIEIRARLHFFSIHTKFHHTGLGRIFMQRIIEKVSKTDVRSFYTYVEETVPQKNLNLLYKNGFKIVGHYNDRYGPGKNALILELKLTKTQKATPTIH